MQKVNRSVPAAAGNVSDPSKMAKRLGRGLRKDRRLPLRVLREVAGKTQAEVAEAAEMDQSEISRVEQRDDLKLSTLRRYARAFDAEIEIAAVLKGGRRIRLDV
jgi:DNA-binding XRE family transcriptional regulator